MTVPVPPLKRFLSFDFPCHHYLLVKGYIEVRNLLLSLSDEAFFLSPTDDFFTFFLWCDVQWLSRIQWNPIDLHFAWRRKPFYCIVSLAESIRFVWKHLSFCIRLFWWKKKKNPCYDTVVSIYYLQNSSILGGQKISHFICFN